MKSGFLLKVWRFMQWAATLMALVMVSSPIETAIPAQKKDSSKVTKDSTEKAEPKKASLRIGVKVMDPEKKVPQSVENATIKIEGEEESYATGTDGKTPSFTVLPGAKTVVIHERSVTCRVNLPVKEGHQDLTVLVETMPNVNCTLQQ